MRKMIKRAWLRWRIAWLKSSPKKQRWVTGGVAAVVLLVILTGSLYARYIKSQEREATVIAKEFYFTSDYLQDDALPMKTFKLNPPIDPADTTSVTITLNNFADDLRVSDVEITYEVKVKVSGSDEEITSMREGGTLAASAGTTASITLDGLKAGTKYEVTAVGMVGYQKTLRAAFDVAAMDETVYKYVDDTDPEENYVLLTVWTKNVAGSATIEIPDGLIPDNTDPAMASATVGRSSFTDTDSFAATYSSHTYRFFKADAGSYSVMDFPVIVSAVSAVPGTP